MENSQDLVAQINRDWAEFKAVLAQAQAEQKTFGATLGDTNSKLDQINARLDELEAKAKRPATGRAAEGSTNATERKAAYQAWFRKGDAGVGPEERKFLYVSDDTAGGYLAEDEMVREIIKGAVEVSPMRSIARVRTTSQRSVKIRKRTQQAAAVWVGAERSTKSATQGPAYGLEEVPNHELYALHDISNQDLEDSVFDVEGELVSEWSEQFGLAEGQAFLSGTGNGEPEGLLAANGGVATVNSGSNSGITYDGMVDLIHAVKSTYARNGVLIFNRLCLGALRKLKDSQNMPIWAPFAAGSPATVLGVPYVEFPDMPGHTVQNNKAAAFGDFKRAYIVVDRIAVSMLRDPYSQATSGAVRFIARKRVGGQVVLPDAVRILKISA